MKAYHFLRENMTAGSGDEKAWEIGEKRTIAADKPSIALCKYGYHSSPSLWDAMNYAPGPMACLVEISKPIDTDDSANQRKAVSASRKLIKAVNIDRELRLFACDCAERVLHIYERNNSSRAPRQAIKVARRFANGKATRKELAAAWAAAWAAADAARDAAWAAAAAAGDAAGDAGDAAWAARDATWDATWAAADAARAAADAARAAADAARAAADAARAAEIKWQRARFEEMFGGIFQ